MATDVAGGSDSAQLDYAWEVTSYIGIALAALGFIGNGFCVKVMLSESVQTLSCSVFFLSLAISDTVVLLFEVMDDIAVHVSGYTANDILYGASNWQCRFGMFAFETCKLSSSWMVVAMSVELVMAVVRPNKRSVIYTWDRAFYVTMAVWLIAVAGCFPFLVITTSTEEHKCWSKYDVFYDVYSGIILHGVTDCFIPVIFICLCNIRSLMSLFREETRYQSGSALDMTDPQGLPPPSLKKSCQAVNIILLTSFMFVLTLLPAHSIDVVYAINRFKTDMVLHQPQWDIAWVIAKTAMLLNYSVKFYLMLLISNEFRRVMGSRQPEQHSGAFYNMGVVVRNGTARRRHAEDNHLQDTRF